MKKPTFDLSSKRAQLAIRFFTYGVMSMTTIILTALLIFVALGYQFNRKELSFAQGGLMQLRSFPQDAAVAIDSITQGFTTPGKTNVTAGQHTVVMRRAGYNNWSKTVTVAAGQLMWLNYARLIPTQLKTDTPHTFDTAYASAASPDRRWYVVQHRVDEPTFTLVDYDNRDEPKFISLALPDSVLAKKGGSFAVIEWDLKSRYILLRHDFDGGREFLRLDRAKPEESINLTRQFALDITEAHFAGDDANELYATTGTVLRRLEISSGTATAPFATDVYGFMIYGKDAVAFTHGVEQTPGDPATKMQAVSVYRRDNGGRVFTARTLALDARVIFAYSEYDDHDYLAIGTADSPKVDIIRDAASSAQKDTTAVFASLELGAPLQWLGFNGTGRMLVAQNANRIATYDLEEAKAYRADIATPQPITKQLAWLDDYYVWTDAGGRLTITEFDGTNTHDLGAVEANQAVMLNADGTRLVALGAKNSKPVLQSTHLSTED